VTMMDGSEHSSEDPVPCCECGHGCLADYCTGCDHYYCTNCGSKTCDTCRKMMANDAAKDALRKHQLGLWCAANVPRAQAVELTSAK
jgi:hypothetical protein